MRIEDLKIFVDVVRYHSMNIAAENNYTTPQNVSKIIKRMENDLDTVLFKRSKKGSELTEIGEQYYLHIIEALHHYNDALSVLRKEDDRFKDNLNEFDSYKISILSSVGVLSYAAMETYNKLQEQNNNLKLEYDEIGYSDIQKILDNIRINSYDIIACCVPRESVDFLINQLCGYLIIHVIVDEYTVVASKDNPLSRRNVVTFEDLKHCKMIKFKDFTSEEIEDDIEYNYTMYTNSHSKALNQIANSRLYCGLFLKKFCELNQKEFSGDGRLRMIQLSEKIYGTYLIALNRKNINNNIMMQFIRTLDNILK